jgi:integrase
MNELTNEDITKVMDKAKTTRNPERDQLIMALSIKAGMKTSHIASLKINDIITDKGTIREQVTIKERTVLLNTEVRRLAESYLTARFSRSLKDIVHLNETLNGHIFQLHLLYNQKRGFFDEWTLPTVIATLYRTAGVKTRPSAGRSTYIRRLVKSGLSVSQMSELSGVRAETMARYLDREERDVRDIIEQM